MIAPVSPSKLLRIERLMLALFVITSVVTVGYVVTWIAQQRFEEPMPPAFLLPAITWSQFASFRARRLRSRLPVRDVVITTALCVATWILAGQEVLRGGTFSAVSGIVAAVAAALILASVLISRFAEPIAPGSRTDIEV